MTAASRAIVAAWTPATVTCRLCTRALRGYQVTNDGYVTVPATDAATYQAVQQGDGSWCGECGQFIPSGADTRAHTEWCPVGQAIDRQEAR